MLLDVPGRDLRNSGLTICASCIFDESVSGITFDDQGICSYCHLVEALRQEFGTGTVLGENRFEALLEEMRRDGSKQDFDVVVGVSGGTDSSYLLVLAKKYGLRPVAVHYDNTWNTAIASQNIHRVTKALSIPLVTYVCNNRESDDIFRSFFRAGVPEIDGPTDIALAEVIYRVAARYGINYVLEGHSFVEEGVAPLGKAYVDGGYIKSVHAQYGERPMKTFPNMTFSRFLFWTVAKRIRKIRPYWYLPYSKAAAQQELEESFGWRNYGGHHLENRMTAFHHGIYGPRKFGLDQRNNSLSALVRAGRLARDEALTRYAEPPQTEPGLADYVCKRFEMDSHEFLEILSQDPHYYTEFSTYKRRFERSRPLFRYLAHRDLVPRSFYLKYCFPQDAPT